MPDIRQKTEQDQTGHPVESMVRDFYEQRKSREMSVVRKSKPLIRSPIVAIVALAVCAAVWATQLLFSEELVDEGVVSPERNARISLFLASVKVNEFQRATGRTPQNLLEASLDAEGLTYVRNTDSTFELSTTFGAETLTLHSAFDAARFLGPDSLLARRK
jgi:hypothetical protein